MARSAESIARRASADAILRDYARRGARQEEAITAVKAAGYSYRRTDMIGTFHKKARTPILATKRLASTPLKYRPIETIAKPWTLSFGRRYMVPVEIVGHDSRGRVVRQRVSVLYDVLPSRWSQVIEDALRQFARQYGMRGKARGRRIGPAILATK